VKQKYRQGSMAASKEV